MVKKRLTKRGVAPLLATVLLIAFAVALGAVVMNWGRSYVEDTANLAKKSSSGQVECSTDVGLSVNRVLYLSSSSTLEDTGLTITVENLKSKKIVGMTIKVMDEDGIGLTYPPLNEMNWNKNFPYPGLSLGPFEVRRITIDKGNFTALTNKTLSQIKIIPYIRPDEDPDIDIISCDDRVISTRWGDEAWPKYRINISRNNP